MTEGQCSLTAAGATGGQLRWRLLLCWLLCWLGTPWALAAAGEGITPFPEAQVAYRDSEAESRSHAIPVDRIARVDGFMQPRTIRQVEGRLRSITWRHPRGVTSEAVYNHLRQQLRGEPWYECQSRDCGPSTHWAHRQFEVADLYGADGSQFYVAVPRATPSGPVLSMLYVVQRGTREVLAHLVDILLEQTDSAAADPQSMARALLDTGVLRMPMVFTAEGEADGDMQPLFDSLATAAEQLPAAAELWVVVHLRDPGRGSQATLDAASLRARALAERLAEAMPERSVAGHGVGALIPGVLGEDDTVVQIVVQQSTD